MHRRILPILLPLALVLAALTALAAPFATPAAWFTANLPTPVPPETVTPLEQALLDHIAGAQVSIDAAFYDFDRPSIRDALIVAHQRGVAVRAVTDLETVTGADAEYVAALVAADIPVVDDGSAGRASADQAQRELDASLAAPIMHNKYLVFDGAAVWTGSTNLSVNDLTRNHNNAIYFESVDLAQVYRYDFEQMFAGRFAGAKTPSLTTTVDYAGTPVEIYFSPQDNAMSHVIAAVDAAQVTIDFAIFYFTDDALADALLAAHARGVRVRGLWDRLGAGNAFAEDERLCADGVPIKVEDTPGILHHKFLAIDAGGAAPKVVTGSLNWTASANDANSENTVIVHDAALAQAYANAFQGMWDGLAEVAACAPAPATVNLPLILRNPDPAPTPPATATAVPTTAPTPTQPPAPTATATAQPGPCLCDRDRYNCSDFGTQASAQACFDYCWAQTGRDVHRLDSDGDRVACESLPLGWRVYGLADE